jgi:trimeric autotransporter adhesin
LPPSAFMLAATPSGAATSNAAAASTSATATAAASSNTTSDVTTTGGTVGTIAAFSTATNIQSSLLSQTGTTAINVKGKFNLPATGTATSSAGKDSQAHTFVASAYDSSTSAAVAQTFQLQAEPAGNDTSGPSGTLNFLFGSGTSAPAETGLKIASNGQITFATGQTFPGTGSGNVTSVGSGAGLTGGPITSSGSLSIATAGVTNAMLANPSLTVAAGTDLTGGGSVALGGSTTLNIDTTKIPQLNNSNTFTQAITINSGNPFGSLQANSTAGSGIVASTSFAGGDGVVGEVTATSGNTAGVLGVSASPSGFGVIGQDTANTSSATSTGVEGLGGQIGVYGNAEGGSSVPNQVGVYGTTNGPINASVVVAAVEGVNTGGGGAGGVFYGSPAISNIAGVAVSTGVLGEGGNDTTSTGAIAGVGGFFFGGNSTNGFPGDGLAALAGTGPSSTGYPVAGVSGYTNGAGPGAFGHDTFLSGTSDGYAGNDYGVWGDTSTGEAGVIGTSDNGFGVMAANASSGTSSYFGYNSSSSSTAQSVRVSINLTGGEAILGGTGCSGTMGLQLGLGGMSSNCENYTLQGDSSGNTYLNASGSGKIVFRINNGSGPSPMTLNNSGSVTIGTLDVTTMLTKPGGSFKIDHPLDPANKYLYHSFVESPDMKNIYDGNVVTDGQGLATVTLPDWFEALNRDFRYQLTVIGQFAQAIVAQEIENNQFQIRTSLPNIKVSWQVTGIRQDAFANAHRIQTEVEKAPADRGHYLHPELFGAPETARIGYEAPSALAPAGEKSASASTRPSSAGRPRQLMRPNRPVPVLPKLPEIKTPPKPTIAQAAK